MKMMNLALPETTHSGLTGQVDVISVSGPGFMTREISKYVTQTETPGVLVVPPCYFYPISNSQRKALTLDNYKQFMADGVGPVYTCHLWHASWQ